MGTGLECPTFVEPPQGPVVPARMSLALTFLVSLAGPVMQDPEAPEDVEVGTTVVTPTAGEKPLLDSPASAQVIDGAALSEQGFRTIPQALRRLPGVMVQETAHGHGSPYLRGFTSFRDLFLIDGVRLNNSVFRPGPNQYWNTVDSSSLDRLEVVMGPSSVLYGSDAIGGTVQAITRGPWLYPDDGRLHGQVSYRTADQANYDMARAEVGGWIGADTGVLIGLTIKDFGDVHGGEEVGLQPETGYDETDVDFKVEHALDATTQLTLLHQEVSQRDVPRTHKTIYGIDWEGLSVGSDLEREFDQDRALTYLQLDSIESGSGLYDDVRVNLSWQEQGEVRDRIKSSGAVEHQGFDVGTLGLSSHFHKQAGQSLWTYGVEYYHDDVNSFLDKESGNSAADDIQGPVADDATYEVFGVFVQDEVPMTDRLDLIAGARWNYAGAESDSVRDPDTDLRTSIDESWSALVGSLRLVYDLDDEHNRLFGGVSQGFRAPNLSDLTRFDSARSNEFEVPSTDLDPEHYTSIELGMRHEGRDLAYQAAVFYTEVSDQIQRVPTGEVNADGDFEVTKANVGEGEVYGLELAGSRRLVDEWSLFGGATLLEGEISTYPTSDPVAVDEPLTRQMPATLHLGLRWDDPAQRLWTESLVTWADDADELNTRDQGDSSRIPPGGTPGYTVVDLRAGYRASDAWSFTLGLENILDEDYRTHGSGVNRPGRNLVFGLTWSF